MEINYSEKELENFRKKKADKNKSQNSLNSSKVNNLQSFFQNRIHTPSQIKAIPPQTPKKEITPPMNLPKINPPFKEPSFKNFAFLKFPLKNLSLKNFSKFLSFKSFIIGGTIFITITFLAFFALNFYFGIKNNYENLKKALFNLNYPDSVHLKTEIFIKSKAQKKTSFYKNFLSYLTAQVIPPPPPAFNPPSPNLQESSNYFSETTVPPVEQNQASEYSEYWEKITNKAQLTPYSKENEKNFNPSINALPENFEFKLTIDAYQKSSPDKNNIEKLKAKVDFQSKIDLISFFESGQILFLNDSVYFKIDRGTLLNLFLPDIIQKWIKVDYKSFFENPTVTDFKQVFPNLFQGNEVLVKKLASFFSGAKIQDIFVIQKSKQEQINNIDTYYYKLTFKKEFFSKIIMEVVKILSEEVVLQNTELDFSKNLATFINELKNNQEKMGKTTDNISQIPFEVWFGKNDNLIYQFKVDIGELISKIGEPPSSTIDMHNYIQNIVQKPQIEGYLQIQYSDYGKDFSIEEPTEYENIEAILSKMGLGNQGEDENLKIKKIRNDKRLGDIKAISLALELYHNDYKKYPVASKWTRLDKPNNPLWSILSSTKYLPEIPKDPLSPDFYYAYKSDGRKYELSARLEYYPEIQNMCDPSTNQICLYIIKGGINKKF